MIWKVLLFIIDHPIQLLLACLSLFLFLMLLASKREASKKEIQAFEVLTEHVKRIDSVNFVAGALQLENRAFNAVLDSLKDVKSVIVYQKIKQVITDTITLTKKDSLLVYDTKNIALKVDCNTGKAIVRANIDLQVVIRRERWKLFGKQRKWLPKKKALRCEISTTDKNIDIQDVKILVKDG